MKTLINLFVNLKTFYFYVVILSSLVLIQTANCQIRVATNGKMGFGTTNPSYGMIDIRYSGSSNGISFISSGSSSFRIFESNNYGYITRAGSTTRGLRMNTYGNLLLFDSNPNNGELFKVVTTKPNARGLIVGPESFGAFTFVVFGNGNTYAANYYTFSDKNKKENIEEIKGSLDKVLAMRAVSYNYIDNINFQNVQQEDPGNDEGLENEIASIHDNKEFSPINSEVEKQLFIEKSRKNVGVIAQELEAVFPDAVRTLANGDKAVSYDHITALLIEAVKEQQKIITEMGKKINKLESKDDNSNLKRVEADSYSISNSDLAVLYQNNPNPFYQHTEIKFELPTETKAAVLYIYNMQGTQIKNYALQQRGIGSITIQGSELLAGMYLYTLIVDGKEVDTKRMILTK